MKQYFIGKAYSGGRPVSLIELFIHFQMWKLQISILAKRWNQKGRVDENVQKWSTAALLWTLDGMYWWCRDELVNMLKKRRISLHFCNFPHFSHDSHCLIALSRIDFYQYKRWCSFLCNFCYLVTRIILSNVTEEFHFSDSLNGYK